jgi:hypothetical protein
MPIVGQPPVTIFKISIVINARKREIILAKLGKR